MNKKEYLVAVREELAGLKSTELQKEMQKLEKKIENQEKKHRSWAEIQKKLGSSREYAEKVLAKYEKSPIEWCVLMMARLLR